MTSEESRDDSWKVFIAGINERLNEHRPARVGRSEEDWREPVYAWARNHMPDESHLVRTIAKREVNRVEGDAAKRGNKMLRQYAHGQAPLYWGELGPYPMIINEMRVRWDAATPDDVDDAAQEIRSNGKRQFDEVTILADTMQELARSARKSGLDKIALIGDQDQIDGDDPDDLDGELESLA